MAGGLCRWLPALPSALPSAAAAVRGARPHGLVASRNQLFGALGDVLARGREEPRVGIEGEHLVAHVMPLLGDLWRSAHDAGRHVVLSGGLCDPLDHAPVAGIPALVA